MSARPPEGTDAKHFEYIMLTDEVGTSESLNTGEGKYLH